MSVIHVEVDGVEYEIAPVAPLRAERPRSDFYAVTREVAASWLRGNHHNRTLRESAFQAQGRDMTTQDWDVNGETIILSRPLKEGEMEDIPAGTVVVLDGQHRLEACEASGAVFVTNVAWGVDPATRRSIDSGAARTMRDVLGMDGEKYSGIMATLLRRQVMWNKGLRRFTGGSNLVTKAEMSKLLNSDPHEFRLASERAYWVTARPDGFHFCPSSAAAQGIYLTRQISVEESNDFFARFRDGEGLVNGNPIKAARQRFMNDIQTGGEASRKRRVAPHQPLAYIVSAWNAHRSGDELMRILAPREAGVPDPK